MPLQLIQEKCNCFKCKKYQLSKLTKKKPIFIGILPASDEKCRIRSCKSVVRIRIRTYQHVTDPVSTTLLVRDFSTRCMKEWMNSQSFFRSVTKMGLGHGHNHENVSIGTILYNIMDSWKITYLKLVLFCCLSMQIGTVSNGTSLLLKRSGTMST